MKILYFLRAFNIGGAETFIYNTLRNIDHTIFHIDFVLQNKIICNERLLSLCKDMECNIYFITPFEKNYLKSIAELSTILRNGGYNIIHIHANALINMVPVIAANRCGVRIALHSHNTHNNHGGIWGTLIHKFNRWYLRNRKILRFACSEDAGKWMYRNKPCIVLNNAVNLNEYKYDYVARQKIRQELNIENDFVIGNVSRFVEAKNHTFMIDVFQEILRLKSGSKLVLLGDGPLFTEIQNKVNKLGLQDDVIFVGAVENTSKYYSAFDCLLFPSLFEGLPFTLVEAQASGLKIFASECITRSVNITNTIEYIDLQKGVQHWARCLVFFKQTEDRLAMCNKMFGSIFDIHTEIKKLENAYLAEMAN